MTVMKTMKRSILSLRIVSLFGTFDNFNLFVDSDLMIETFGSLDNREERIENDDYDEESIAYNPE